MSRWGESAYYERQAPVYRDGRRYRDTRELDVEIDERTSRNARSARSVPEFLREDYDRRATSGALVIREDDHDRYHRRGERRDREEKEEIVIRKDDRGSTRIRVEEDDTRSVRSGRLARTERPRERLRSEERSKEEIDIRIRRDDDERPRVRNRDVEREEVIIRRTDDDRHRSVVKEEDIIIRSKEDDRVRTRPREVVKKEEVIIRRDRSASSGSSRSRSPPRRHADAVVKDRVVVRGRDRSLPPGGRLVARETEEFVIRRRRESPSSSSSSSPSPPPRERRQEEIIIRRTERSVSPPPVAPVAPIVETKTVIEEDFIRRPVIKEEIHRDIIYHHRHFDHGVEVVRRDEPAPTVVEEVVVAEPAREEELEVAIHRRDSDGEREDIIIKERKGDRRNGRRHRSRARSVVREEDVSINAGVVTRRDRSVSLTRSRSVVRGEEYGLAGEAEYYNRRHLERARVGEAYNGATRDWALVDVPPGTARVRMDGIGGGAQEVTWQRYNGARRSRFIADGEEYVAYPDFDDRRERIAVAETTTEAVVETETVREEPKTTSVEISIRDKKRGDESVEIVKKERKSKEMWTEITKDLVLKEAIESVGYGYEETDLYFYVMDYLRPEDVQRLVEVSDDIRRRRRRRIREIEHERDFIDRGPAPLAGERVYERDVFYERRRR